MLTSKPHQGQLGDIDPALAAGGQPTGWTHTSRPVKVALIQGFVGSMLVVAGSIGVGWLAGSSGLIRTPLFILARTSPIAVIICTILLCLGALLLVRSWLRLAQRIGRWDGEAQKILIKALLLWSVPLAFSLPLFSRDIYSYIGQGRLMMQGLDPYTNGISALNNYYSMGPDTLWTEAPTPYGPLFLWIEQFAAWVGFGIPEISIIPFRLAAMGGVALCAIYVPKLAALYGMNPARTLWLTVLNPVVLFNFVCSAHNDSLMLGLVVAGIYFASTKKPVLGILLVTASIAVKPITLVALPFIGLIWAGSKAGWGRKIWCWVATAALSLGLLWVCGIASGLGFGWVGALGTSGTVWIWYAPIGASGALLGGLTSLFGGPGQVVTDVVHLIGKAVSVIAVVWLAIRGAAVNGGNAANVRRMAWAFAAVVLLAPMVQPWYLVWLLVFFGVTGIRDDWQLRVVLYLTTFFTLIALTDQLSVFQWISIAAVRAVAIAVGVSLALYLMFIDKKTKGFFGRPWTIALRRQRVAPGTVPERLVGTGADGSTWKALRPD